MTRSMNKKIAHNNFKQTETYKSNPKLDHLVEQALDEGLQEAYDYEGSELYFEDSNGNKITLYKELDREDLQWYRAIMPLVNKLSLKLPPSGKIANQLNPELNDKVVHELAILQNKIIRTISIFSNSTD